MLGGVGREREFRVSRDPQTRGKKKRRLREAGPTPKTETHAKLGPPLAALRFRVCHSARTRSKEVKGLEAEPGRPGVGGGEKPDQHKAFER